MKEIGDRNKFTPLNIKIFPFQMKKEISENIRQFFLKHFPVHSFTTTEDNTVALKNYFFIPSNSEINPFQHRKEERMKEAQHEMLMKFMK